MVEKRITLKDQATRERVREAFSHGVVHVGVKSITPEEREARTQAWRAEREAERAEWEQKRAEETAAAQAVIAARATTFEPASIEVTWMKLGMAESEIVFRRFGAPNNGAEAQAARQRMEDLAFYRHANGITARPMKLPQPAAPETPTDAAPRSTGPEPELPSHGAVRQ